MNFIYKVLSILIISLSVLFLICYSFHLEIEKINKKYEKDLIEYQQEIEELRGIYEVRVEKLQSEIDFMELSLQAASEGLLIHNEEIEISEDEWDLLYRVAAAEAGYRSEEGIKNVCYVVFNRMKSDKFPNTLKEVLLQEGQFSSPPKNKMVTEDLIEYVHIAYEDFLLKGEVADGALFFCKGNFNSLEFLFEDELGHRFFK